MGNFDLSGGSCINVITELRNRLKSTSIALPATRDCLPFVVEPRLFSTRDLPRVCITFGRLFRRCSGIPDDRGNKLYLMGDIVIVKIYYEKVK